MSGLLGALGGLGQGIAGVGKMMADDITQRENTDRMMNLEAWRENLRAKYAIEKDAIDAARKDKDAQKLIDATMAARKYAEDAPVNRDAAGMLSYGKRNFEGAPTEMSADDMETLRNLPPEARKVYEETGVLKKQDSQRQTYANDLLEGSQRTGNTTLVNQSLKGVDDARAADVADFTRARSERKDDETARHNREMELIKTKAEMFKAGNLDPTDRMILTEQLRSAGHTVDRLSKELAEYVKNPMLSTSKDPEVIAARNDLALQLKNAREIQNSLMTEFSSLRKPNKGGDAEAPKDAEAPRTEPEKRGLLSSGGSKYAGVGADGKPRYTPVNGVPDVQPSDLSNQPKTDTRPTAAEKDKVAIYQQALQEAEARVQATQPGTPARTRAESDVKEIQAEMQRAGLSANPSASNPTGGQSERLSQFKVIR